MPGARNTVVKSRGEATEAALAPDADPNTQRVKRFRAPSEVAILGRDIVGRYRVRRKIADGAIGHIYEAVQLPIGRRVALKIVSVDGGDEGGDRIRKRFHREASIAARVAHPNIVSIFDFGETEEGDLFMAMEYVGGRPLSEVALETGRFEGRRALAIAIQLVRALRKAHEQGVVHRDLKPANIMVVRDEDDDDFIKVLDFGIVKIFSEEEQSDPGVYTDENLTRAGVLLGTPGYMAPEQALGEVVDERADIYSVGVILYQLLTGRPPFEADTIVDLIRLQVMNEAPFLREVDPDAECSAELEALIHRCLHRSRDRRPETSRELLAQLKSIWRIETDESYGTETSLTPYRVGDTEFPSVSVLPGEIPIEDPSVVGRIPSAVRVTPPKPVRTPRWLWGAALVVLVVAGLAAGVWLGAYAEREQVVSIPVRPELVAPGTANPAAPLGSAPAAKDESAELDPLPEGDADPKPAEDEAPGYLDNPY